MRTAYQEAVAAGIVAAGHKVEWIPNSLGRETLMIDGLHCGSELRPIGLYETVEVDRVSDAVTYRSVWRARKLSPDAAKAVPVLLDRHASVLSQRERTSRVDAARRSNAALTQTLSTAVGAVPELRLEATAARVTVSLTVPSLTVAQAQRLGAALREILGS